MQLTGAATAFSWGRWGQQSPHACKRQARQQRCMPARARCCCSFNTRRQIYLLSSGPLKVLLLLTWCSPAPLQLLRAHMQLSLRHQAAMAEWILRCWRVLTADDQLQQPRLRGCRAHAACGLHCWPCCMAAHPAEAHLCDSSRPSSSLCLLGTPILVWQLLQADSRVQEVVQRDCAICTAWSEVAASTCRKDMSDC